MLDSDPSSNLVSSYCTFSNQPDTRKAATTRRLYLLTDQAMDIDEDNEFRPPFEPEAIPKGTAGSLTKFCVSPTNGRMEWIQATVLRSHLNTGSDITDEMHQFAFAGESNPGDEAALVIHKSLGGTGDDVYNVFLQGRSFDREVFDNEVESSVYYALKDGSDSDQAVITVRFVFKNNTVTRPYKLRYAVLLPNGDLIENELINV